MLELMLLLFSQKKNLTQNDSEQDINRHSPFVRYTDINQSAFSILEKIEFLTNASGITLTLVISGNQGYVSNQNIMSATKLKFV